MRSIEAEIRAQAVEESWSKAVTKSEVKSAKALEFLKHIVLLNRYSGIHEIEQDFQNQTQYSLKHALGVDAVEFFRYRKSSSHIVSLYFIFFFEK